MRCLSITVLRPTLDSLSIEITTYTNSGADGAAVLVYDSISQLFFALQ